MTALDFFRKHSFTFRNIVAKHYPLSEQMLDACFEYFNPYWLQRNPHLSDAALKKYKLKKVDSFNTKKEHLEEVPVSEFIDQSQSTIPFIDDNLMSGSLSFELLSHTLRYGAELKYLQLKAQHLNWTFELYDLLYNTKNGISEVGFGYTDSPYFYKSLFEPYLNDTLIEQVLTEKYQAELAQTNMKYYSIHQGGINEMIDIFVATQDIECLYMGYTNMGNWLHLDLKEMRLPVPEIHGTLLNNYGTFPVAADFVKIWNDKWGVKAVFSERVKTVLEQFNLPPHRFTPIICTWDDRIKKKYKITESVTYYAFMADSDDLWKNLDYKNSKFGVVKNSKHIFEKGFVNDLVDMENRKIDSFSDFKAQRDNSTHWLDIICTKFVSPQNWDAIGYDYQFLINEDIKNALEKLKPVSMQFSNYEGVFCRKALHFYMEGAETAEHRQHNATIIQNVVKKRIVSSEMAEAENLIKQQLEKIERLKKQTDLVEKYYAAKNDAAEISEDEKRVRAKEVELNVIFPKNYRSKLLANKLPKTMKRYYEVIKFEDISNNEEQDWVETAPEAINALTIAVDGCGNYIGYLLKEEHDFFLDNKLVFFNHENGKVEEI